MHNGMLHKFWWLWLPIVFMVVQLVMEFTLPFSVLAPMHNENGPHETLQFFIIFAAFIVAVRILSSRELRGHPGLYAWVGIAALCSLYVAGEEISWGQHFLHWTTPDFWSQINDQNETNLHNISSWLDQKPKLLLIIGVGVGGLLIPLLQSLRPQTLPQKFSVIYPSAILGVTAALALGVMVTHKIEQALNVHIFTRANEVQELYLFYFVLLYLVVLRGRILQRQR